MKIDIAKIGTPICIFNGKTNDPASALVELLVLLGTAANSARRRTIYNWWIFMNRKPVAVTWKKKISLFRGSCFVLIKLLLGWFKTLSLKKTKLCQVVNVFYRHKGSRFPGGYGATPNYSSSSLVPKYVRIFGSNSVAAVKQFNVFGKIPWVKWNIGILPLFMEAEKEGGGF